MGDTLSTWRGDSVFVITRTMEVRKGLSLGNVIALGGQLYSTMYLNFITLFFFCFHDSGVGGGLSSPEVSPFVDARLILLRYNSWIATSNILPISSRIRNQVLLKIYLLVL